MANLRRFRKEADRRHLKKIVETRKVPSPQRETSFREHSRSTTGKTQKRSLKIIIKSWQTTKKDTTNQGQKSDEARHKTLVFEEEEVTSEPKHKRKNKKYRSKSSRKKHSIKRKNKTESEANYSTLIHNLDNSTIIPNKIGRILNFNLKYNFDSVPNRTKIDLDFSLFTHRVVATGIRCSRIPNPNKTISDYEPKFRDPDTYNNLHTSSEIPALQAYLDIAKMKIREGFPKLQTRRLFRNNDKQTLLEWFKNNNVVVKQTDKNLGIAIIPISVYHSKVMELLNDTQTYQRIDTLDSNTLVEDYKTFLNDNIIKKIRYSSQEFHFLIYYCKNKFQLPQFHIIPKIHKKPWIGRPIVSNVNYITRHLAIWINVFLEKITKTIPTTLKDSKQLIQLLDGKQVRATTNFFSLDAISMYTNIPLQRTFAAMRRLPDHYPEYIIRGLEFCCKNNYFSYMDETYKQLDGLPMGINFAVAFANISVFILIETSPRLLKYRDNIIFWGRYIDDCNGLWDGTREDFNCFWETMNSIDESIQWTIGEFGKRVVYLDLYAIIDDSNTISFELYQKKLNKYLYLPFHSTHSLATKKGWIKGELIRLCRNNSKQETFQKCVHLFFNRLRERRYPYDFIIEIYEQFSFKTRNNLLRMEENEFDTIPSTTMERFFQIKMKTFHKEASEKFGIKEVTRQTLTQPLNFITDYNSQIKLLGLKRILDPLPAFELYKPYPESEVRIGYRIQNTLGSIFSHKKHNEKIKTYLQSLEHNN